MTFNKGDLVLVCMAHDNCFNFQRSPRFRATITRTPYGPGDLWRFRVELMSYTVHIAINPSAADFIGLVAIP